MSVHDRWNGNRTGPGKRWEIRYRAADGKQIKRRFDNRDAAQAADANRRIEPSVAKAAAGRALTIDDMMARWLSTKDSLAQKTLDAYLLDAREVTDAFGGRLAASVDPSEVLVWVGRKRGISYRRRSLTALKAAYRIAVKDQLLATSPCVGAKLPPAEPSERRALTWDQIELLANESGRHAPLVWLYATSGLRLGEAIGIRVGDVNLATGRIRIATSVVDTSKGRQVGAPKGGKRRDVAVPRFVLDMLPLEGRPADAWLFTGEHGGRLDPPSWRRQSFQPAAVRAGLGHLVPHEMRHTAAALAIQAGADVYAVQRMMGHAKPSITLDVYGKLWESGIDAVAARMNQRGAIA